MASLETVVGYLKNSLNPQFAKESEKSLREFENSPGFAISLLNIVASNEVDSTGKLAAALYFKNLIKRKWTDEDGNYQISMEDVTAIKSEIIGLMIQLPSNLQVQVGEAVSIIADSDFPDRWPNLIDDLVSRLGSDITVNRGVLTVAHSIFKRWRPLFRSDALFLEIKFVLDRFCVPFLTLLQETNNAIEANKNNKDTLRDLYDVLLLLIKIYYDLNCQDIPEFFEDHMEECMKIVHKYYSTTFPLLETEDDEESGVMEKVKSAICELLELYTVRYEDVFHPLIPDFIQTTWGLLTTTGPAPKYDFLVSKAMSFLTSVIKIPSHSHIFETEPVLQEVTDQIILPNMRLRPSDEELFEFDPIEYIRRDLEGSDSDTRRRAATDFLRQLKERSESTVTQVVMKYVNHYLQEYENDRAGKWRSKDIAIYLFSSIAMKGALTQSGVSGTNLILDVVGFFTQSVAPGLVEENTNPILKVDAIKYIYTFRNQLTKAQLLEALPLLAKQFTSDEYVVYTYAAITIERILAIRKQDGSNGPLFTKADIPPVILKELIVSLFKLIAINGNSPEKLAENEFLMKCIMRVLLISEELVVSIGGEETLKQLLSIILLIARNPSNPKFTHYTFEAVSVIIKFGTEQLGVKNVEQLVIPQLLVILQEDISEFIPYVLQVYSLILELTPKANGLSESFRSLVRPLLSPAIWEFKGNIPAVVRFLEAVLRQDYTVFITEDLLTALLGVFQKLIASKAHDNYGFDLLKYIFTNVPIDKMAPYVKEIARLLLQRLQTARTDKYIREFAKFDCFLATVNSHGDKESEGLINGPLFATHLFDDLQDGVYGAVFQQFIIPSVDKFPNPLDQKIVIIGLLNILTKNPNFIGGKYSAQWTPSLDILIKSITNEAILKPVTGPDANSNSMFGGPTAVVDAMDLEDVTFGATYSKLAAATVKPWDPVPNISLNPSPSGNTLTVKDVLVRELRALDSETGGSVSTQVIPNLSEEAKAALIKLGF